MMDMNEIQTQFDAVMDEKIHGDCEAVWQSIVDNGLATKWLELLQERDKVDSMDSFAAYQKKLTVFFSETCQTITSPGVGRFIQWLESLNSKFPLIGKKKKWLRFYLTDHYADHNEEIKQVLFMITHFFEDDFTDCLFPNIKTAIQTIVAKTVHHFEGEKEGFIRELPGFMSDLCDLAKGLDNLDELNFQQAAHFYVENWDEADQDDFQPVFDDDAAFHEDMIKKMVDAKDGLTTDLTKICIKKIYQEVDRTRDDIYNSIERLKSLNMRQENDNVVLELFDRFERFVDVSRPYPSMEEHLHSMIDELWTPTYQAYVDIDQAFDRMAQVDIDMFNQVIDNMGHDHISIQSDLQKFAKDVAREKRRNPHPALDMNQPFDEVARAYQQRAEALNQIRQDEGYIKLQLITYFNGLIHPYQKEKTALLRKWNVERAAIQSIKDELSGVKSVLDIIRSADELIPTLNQELDGLVSGYTTIKDAFFTCCKEKGITPETLKYFESLRGKQFVDIAQLSDEATMSKIKTLVENGLIKLSVEKKG
jgi:hypothetical protein